MIPWVRDERYKYVEQFEIQIGNGYYIYGILNYNDSTDPAYREYYQTWFGSVNLARTSDEEGILYEHFNQCSSIEEVKQKAEIAYPLLLDKMIGLFIKAKELV